MGIDILHLSFTKYKLIQLPGARSHVHVTQPFVLRGALMPQILFFSTHENKGIANLI